MTEDLGRTPIFEDQAKAAECIYREWDRAWGSDDLEAMIALYAPDATLESPVVAHLLGRSDGRLKGRDHIRALLEKAAPRKPGVRHFHREGYFTSGGRLVWEYPRATPDGGKMDFFEVMDIEDGLIRTHSAYRGWRGVEVIKADACHKGG